MAILKKIVQYLSGIFTRKEPAPVYADCAQCEEHAYLPYRCNYCNRYYCGKHRLPFNHDCDNIDDWKKRRSPSGSSTEYRGGNVQVRK